MTDTATIRSPAVRLADVEPGIPPPQRRAPPAPLLPIAFGLVLGIIADYELSLPTGSALAVCGAAAAATLLRWRRSIVGPLALVASAAGLGALRHDLAFRRIATNHIACFTQDWPILAKVRGRIVSEPQIIEPNPSIPRAYEQGPKTRFVIEAEQIGGRDGPIPVCGKVAMTIKAPLPLLQAGDVIELSGWVYRPSPPQNPGAYDWALAMRRAGILVGMSAQHAESVAVVARPPDDWQGSLRKARNRLSSSLLHDAFDDDDPGAGVIEAMVLGQRGAVPRAMNEAFVKTGNAHFLAASGMNVGWLALMGWGVMRLIGAYYRTTAIVVALLILSFVLLAEPEPSILRAGVIGLLGCLSLFLRGRPSVINWLACSAIVVLMIDPCDLFRPGFQLSFLGVLGVMHFSVVIRQVIGRWIPGIVPFELATASISLSSPYAATLIMENESSSLAAFRWVFKASAYCVSVTCAVWLVTAPLTCYLFGQFAPWGIIGTLILWLPAFLATLVGYLKVFVGLVLPSSAVVFGPLLGGATNLMTGTVELLAKLPFTVIDGRSPSLVWVLACYGLMAWRTYRPQWMKWRHGFTLLTVVLIVWWLLPPRWFTHDRQALQVWMLAVGDGSANVIELPNGKVLVCDFGTRSPFDAGAQAAAFVKSRGIRRIDAIIVSHADFDHYSAVERIVRDFDVGRVVINDHFEIGASHDPAATRLLQGLRDLHVPIEVTHGNSVFDDGLAKVESLWPPACIEGILPDDNDRSTVLRLTCQGRTVLLPGDIGNPAMASLLQNGDLKADVLALPHHGSVVSSTVRFLAAVDPAICIRSCGQPRRLTVSGIEEIVGRRQFFNTADDGCVRVRIAGGRVSAEAVMRPQ
jgi:competence protein ComEC